MDCTLLNVSDTADADKLKNEMGIDAESAGNISNYRLTSEVEMKKSNINPGIEKRVKENFDTGA